jgi:hypothetical protein
MTPAFISIVNDAADIVSTDYWETENAARGAYYLSINAGTFRLLVPPALVGEIEEWRTAREVIVSRGPWPEKGRADAIEILFEDRSDSPYVVHIGTEQVDRLPTDADQDRPGRPPRWTFTAWARGGKVLTLPCRYRRVKHIPWLKRF